MNDDDRLHQTYGAVLANAVALNKEGVPPIEIAACLANIALGIYKTCLTEENYDDICQKIVSSRHLIAPFDIEHAIPLNRTLH